MYGMAVLLVYFIIMMGATMLLSKKETSQEGFLVGNRRMGTISSAMSIAATWIWAPALFVSADKAYTNGIPGLFWFLIPNVICLILFIPFARKIREQFSDGMTLSGYMWRKYKSQRVKGVYLFQLSSLAILSTAVQLLAGGKVLEQIIGAPFWLLTIVLAVIAYSYSQFSGLRASILTDAVQMILILSACAVFLPWAICSNGLNSLVTGLSGNSGEYGSLVSSSGLEVFFAFGLPTAIGLISGPFGDQCFWQRAFAVRRECIVKAFTLGAFLFAVVPASMGALGFIAAGTGYIANDAGFVNLELIIHLFPSWTIILFLFMVVSGLLSTVDSNLCAAAALTSDIRKDESLRLPKTAMLVLLVMGILVANIPEISVTNLFLIYGILRSTTLAPTVLTLLGKQLPEKGIFYGVAVAMFVCLPIFAFGTLTNVWQFKTVGSLLAVILPGMLAFTFQKKVIA